MNHHPRLAGVNRLEFLLVVLLISILALVAYQRFELVAEKAEATVMNSAAEVFSSAASLVRIKWITSGHEKAIEPYRMALPEYHSTVTVNAEGWPLSFLRKQPASAMTREDCESLYEGFLRQPLPADPNMGSSAANQRFFSRFLKVVLLGNRPSVCRYELSGRNNNRYIFEYDSNTGHVTRFAVPTQ